MLNRRSLLRNGLKFGSLALVLPGSSLAGPTMNKATAGPAIGSSVDPASLVPPEFAAALEQVRNSGPIPDINAQNLTATRAYGSEGPALATTPIWERRTVAGAKGAPDVAVYVINAGAAGANKPAILHMHGGGYILGRAADGVGPMQKMAQELDCVIVSVDYRLAPETRFPGSLEDNYSALRWLYESSQQLGVNRQRIAVMGESAGGGHAAMLAIAARDRREFPLVAQVLIYPMLDDRTGSTRAVPAHIGTFMWTRGSNRFGWSSLLGRPAGSARVPPGSVPARVADLAGLPPTFIGVGSIDLFVQEDTAYAQRLVEAGVATELEIVPGGYHGFDFFAPEAPLSKHFREAWMNALKRAFA
jgi:acetyl esterase/lipase